ncbi:hypothetical protein IF2G_06165 [Cordyceps javanica]|nr:hypothetical protein IF2G_06165 [Cordyceps javanica]
MERIAIGHVHGIHERCGTNPKGHDRGTPGSWLSRNRGYLDRIPSRLHPRQRVGYRQFVLFPPRVFGG